MDHHSILFRSRRKMEGEGVQRAWTAQQLIKEASQITFNQNTSWTNEHGQGTGLLTRAGYSPTLSS